MATASTEYRMNGRNVERRVQRGTNNMGMPYYGDWSVIGMRGSTGELVFNISGALGAATARGLQAAGILSGSTSYYNSGGTRFNAGGQAIGTIQSPNTPPQTVAQGLAGQYQTAYDEARAANETRYQDILASYDTMGQTRSAEITRRFGSLATQANQDLVSRGLRASTIAPTVQAGIAREAASAQTQLQEAVTGAKAGVMERRTDTYPDQGMYLGLMQGLGRSTPMATGGGGRYSSLGNQGQAGGGGRVSLGARSVDRRTSTGFGGLADRRAIEREEHKRRLAANREAERVVYEQNQTAAWGRRLGW